MASQSGYIYPKLPSLTVEQIMRPTASEKATERGKRDCRNGVTRNPYQYIGGAHKHLASWWDKGFAEEQARQKKQPALSD